MEFGVFDHLDRPDGNTPSQRYYEERLKLVALYDARGFYAYHLAEHHATPLGMAPSPSVFLAAVAQRTRRLRFGPLVYAMPLYHPLRLIEEICMLDQLSGGRLDIGSGAHFKFDGVPMGLEPVQKPHPPVWYGVHSPDSAERAARAGFHTVSLDPPDEVRASAQRYIAAWRATRGDAPMPRIGIGRFIVVAETDAEALALARRAYPVWHASFTYLFRLTGQTQRHPRPGDFDTLAARGQGVAGAPATVADDLRRHVAETGANYLVGQFAFGDMSYEESRQSIELFSREVMPAFDDFSPSPRTVARGGNLSAR
jgi:alkanesulfonate monooxygenase SsuD/methylene tetrahydromethanopterin reductase-like flavin-dependent oxidoreductase (luciferase family)